MSLSALKMLCVHMHLLCMCVCTDIRTCTQACMCIFFQVVIRTWKIPSNHIMHIVVYVKPISRIRTPVMVKNRAVIERQSRVRLVVAKAIIPNAQAGRKVIRQKQCHPAPNQYFMFVESASCKNSETSCLDPRHKFGGVKQLTKIRYAHCSNIQTLQAKTTDATKLFNWSVATHTEHVKWYWFCFFMFMYARTSWDRGWCKKDIARWWVGKERCIGKNV